TTHDLPAVGVSVTLPPRWTLRKDGHTATAESADGQMWLSLRRGGPGDGANLVRVRQAVERTELGPSHLAAGCEARLTEQLLRLTGWPTLQVSVTRRALGQRRRAFAIFAPLADGTLTAVLTAKWRRAGAAPLHLIRPVLRSLRAR
ncbi:MAG: hypothetical protein QF464_23910, partial [Myxococcota bacterium]|nr:hypothetical protein [Myxococcota bacterium]